MTRVAVEVGGVRLEMPVPAGWSVEPFAPAALVLRDPDRDASGFRTNVIVRAHRAAEAPVLGDLLEVAVQAIDVPEAALERRGRVELELDGGSGIAGLVLVDAAPSVSVEGPVVRVAQLHAFLDAAPPGPDPAPGSASGPGPGPASGDVEAAVSAFVVFQIVATGSLSGVARSADAYAGVFGGLVVTTGGATRGT